MASIALASADDVRAFIEEYFEAWSGTDEERILSYYAETVLLEIPGMRLNGSTAVRDQFIRPFIAGFPGNRHKTKKMIFGKDLDSHNGAALVLLCGRHGIEKEKVAPGPSFASAQSRP